MCYIIHNAAKHACKHLSYDVDASVIKAFNEFSASGKKNPEGKQSVLGLCLGKFVFILSLLLSQGCNYYTIVLFL